MLSEHRLYKVLENVVVPRGFSEPQARQELTDHQGALGSCAGYQEALLPLAGQLSLRLCVQQAQELMSQTLLPSSLAMQPLQQLREDEQVRFGWKLCLAQPVALVPQRLGLKVAARSHQHGF